MELLPSGFRHSKIGLFGFEPIFYITVNCSSTYFQINDSICRTVYEQLMSSHRSDQKNLFTPFWCINLTWTLCPSISMRTPGQASLSAILYKCGAWWQGGHFGLKLASKKHMVVHQLAKWLIVEVDYMLSFKYIEKFLRSCSINYFWLWQGEQVKLDSIKLQT